MNTYNRIEVDEAKVKMLYYDGIGARKIADALGVGRKVITRVIRENKWHRSSYRNTGKKRVGKPQKELSVADLWCSVIKDDITNCWVWTGRKDRKGYGFLVINKKRVAAHRLSYKLKHSNLSDHLYVCHKCDNPSCVNPDHLFTGTNRVNMIDCLLKNRKSDTKIKVEDVRKIRLLYKEGNSMEKLADVYNVKPSTIKNIITRVSWYYVI